MLAVTIVTAMVAVAAAEQATVQVTLQQGAITGSREEAINGRMYYSFKSIPYAKPPVGPLRFKNPEPADPWSGVRNGSLPIPKCPQLSSRVPGAIEGQEDCLYLNVYTPKPSPSNLPVMVYIHGGGFAISSAGEGGSPAPLMQKDIVLVTMNYRLGTLGFLSTNDNILPGNLGLKDQVLALQWVQDNIELFGGNPKQVTIFGVSAGGISVHFHILSPSSKELFQRAILHSGTALLLDLFKASQDVNKVGTLLNCTGSESQQLLDCFRQATVEDLVKIPTFLGGPYNMPIPIGPSIDGSFLPDHPVVLLKQGRYNKVDVISGNTKDDANGVGIVLFSENGKQVLQELNNNITKMGPILLAMTENENPTYLAQRVLFKYMPYNKDFNFTHEDEVALTQILTDHYYRINNIRTTDFHAQDSNVKTFMYQFDHEPERSYEYIIRNATQIRPMAGHGDDIRYLLQLPDLIEPWHRVQDLYMQEILVTLWTNFASTGNPTINGTLGFRWTPVAHNKQSYYLSLTTTPSMQPVNSKILEFWNCLPTSTSKQLYPELFLPNSNKAC
ncbi:esterase FE4-like isoform X2 [Portunus trituberculatus]|uniref:esterase FE4-like isoform X1 n=1 Tax=Portunus trituberculatus TaxID=210409 RepID=UPI001E1D05C6|nr:esterase FE4-like isoform X1 [Portunus trituberculatus]XP_045128052.1 esterase FE4-like isoform X1 [Portunus trituberculatus]XP_045128053.1 esterase FE4-like isoform X2 [Portunus trituberculatus]